MGVAGGNLRCAQVDVAARLFVVKVVSTVHVRPWSVDVYACDYASSRIGHPYRTKQVPAPHFTLG